MGNVWDYVANIARMLRDGETDDDGNEYIMENDDAVDALNALIGAARNLIDNAVREK